MAKRQAENQASKNDAEEESTEEPGVRSAPFAPVEGRVVRGLPKRRGIESAGPTPTPAPVVTSSVPVPLTSTAPASNPFSTFSFGASNSNSSSFAFGQTSATSALTNTSTTAPKPFAGFSFGNGSVAAPASSAVESSKPTESIFSLGQKPAQLEPDKPTDPPKSFGNPSFAAATSTFLPTPNEEKKKEPKPAFSFGGPSSTFKEASKPATPFDTVSSIFSVGSISASAFPSPSVAPEASKPTFSFGVTSASTSSKESPMKTKTAEEESSTKPLQSSSATNSEGEINSTNGEAAQKPSFGFGKPATFASTSSDADTKQPVKAPMSFSFGHTTSFGSSSSPQSNSVTTPASRSMPVPPIITSSESEPLNPAETAYYTQLRGLNQSTLKFFTSLIEKDQFINLCDVLPNLGKQYGTHLQEVEKKIGWKPKVNKANDKNTSEKGKEKNSVVLAADLSLPKAPASGFSLPKAPSSSSTQASSGFTPSAFSGTNKSGFTFPATTSTKPFSSASKDTSAAVNKLISDALAEKPDKTMEKDAKLGKANETSTSKVELAKKSTSLFMNPTTPSKPSSDEPSAQLLGKFGPGGSIPTLSFGAKASGSPAATNSAFSFGKSSISAGGSVTGFSFGSHVPAPAKTTSAASSLTQPLSFNISSPSQPFVFGKSPVVQPSANAPSFSASLAPFSAASSTVTTAPTSSEATPVLTDGEDTAGEPSTNLATTAGAGEENEDTLYEVRGKLNKLEDGRYISEGLGIFKMKKEKKGSRRRLLMRTDGNGNVIMNMVLKSTFSPSADGSFLKFLGFNTDGKPTLYALRVKTAQSAEKVKEALAKEVENIKDEEKS
ncbi:uncharacterized protein L203_103414 [Cryptococcus depauperatus CBS 7841]|uniref:Uncharacterized protein n=1 Tax=Cryptococcus depauperatus CBS 7841 TaxID=1295531 RepID=A0A1E3IIG2_9TREE|nr:hypothetical protein L203_02992 [Cryptococcus depauperatus CBS 7841]